MRRRDVHCTTAPTPISRLLSFQEKKRRTSLVEQKKKRVLQRLLIRLLLSKEGGKASFSLAIQKILSPPTGSIFTTAPVVSVSPLDMKYALPR